MPQKLFRYRTAREDCLGQLRTEIVDGQIYLASLWDLNDPDEPNWILKYHDRDKAMRILQKAQVASSTAAQVLRVEDLLQACTEDRPEWRACSQDVMKEVGRRIGVACFTTADSPLMWREYAKWIGDDGSALEQGGLRLTYKVDELWAGYDLREVTYTDAPRTQFLDIRDPVKDIPLFKKGTQWRAESEWRMVADISPCESKGDCVELIKLPQGCLIEIRVGKNAPGQLREAVEDWVQFLIPSPRVS